MKKNDGSLCYFAMHQPDVVLLDLRFDCFEVECGECLCEISEMGYERDEERMMGHVLFV